MALGSERNPGRPDGAVRRTRSGRPLSDAVRDAVRRRYGAKADAVRNAEAFELCEYGRRPAADELSRLFPF
jgi:hypothetical protein